MKKIIGSENLDFVENAENVDHISLISGCRSMYIAFRNRENVLKIIFDSEKEAEKAYEGIVNFFENEETKDQFLWVEDFQGINDLVLI